MTKIKHCPECPVRDSPSFELDGELVGHADHRRPHRRHSSTCIVPGAVGQSRRARTAIRTNSDPQSGQTSAIGITGVRPDPFVGQ